MPIKKVKGGFVASYAGKSRTFKTRSAAEKWAAKYKKGGEKELAEYSPWRSPNQPRKSRVPGRGKGRIA